MLDSWIIFGLIDREIQRILIVFLSGYVNDYVYRSIGPTMIDGLKTNIDRFIREIRGIAFKHCCRPFYPLK